MNRIEVGRNIGTEDNPIFEGHPISADTVMLENGITIEEALQDPLTGKHIADCNDITLPTGLYRTRNYERDGIPATLNAPISTQVGVLEVKKLGTASNGRFYVQQIFYRAARNDTWSRNFGDIRDTWSPWVRVTSRTQQNLPTRTIDNVNPSDLQNIINSLPKALNESVIINLTAGENPNRIYVNDFSNARSFSIRGVQGTRLGSITTENCSVSFMDLRNIEFVTPNVTKINILRFSGNTFGIRSCTSTAGINTNTSNRFINIQDSAGTVQFEDNNSLVSNHNQVIRAINSPVRIMNLIFAEGTSNNTTLVNSQDSSNVVIQSTPNISTLNFAGQLYIQNTGGKITSTDGSDLRRDFAIPTTTYNNVHPNDLQRVLNELIPRTGLLRNIQINLTSGTTTEPITLRNYGGIGNLQINGATTEARSVVGRVIFQNINTVVEFSRVDSTNNVVDTANITISSIRGTGTIIWENSTIIGAGRNSVGNNGANVNSGHLILRSVRMRQLGRAIHCRNIGTVTVGNCNLSDVETAFYESGATSTIYSDLNTVNTIPTANRGETNQNIFVDGRPWSFLPTHDNTISLGNATRRFTQLFAANGTISTSDAREKTDIQSLDQKAIDFLMKLNPVSYKRIDGESGRKHYGLLAQEVYEAMEAVDITDKDFAGYIKSPLIEETQSETDFEEIEHKVTKAIQKEVEKTITKQVIQEVFVPLPTSRGRNAQAVGSFDTEIVEVDGISGYYETKEVEIEEIITEIVDEEVEEIEIERIPKIVETVVGERLGLRYEEFIAPLIKAFQMQQAEIESLQSDMKKIQKI